MDKFSIDEEVSAKDDRIARLNVVANEGEKILRLGYRRDVLFLNISKRELYSRLRIIPYKSYFFEEFVGRGLCPAVGIAKGVVKVCNLDEKSFGEM